jgi:inactivated superfamily I helicase
MMNPEVVAALEDIRKKNAGILRPADVVEAARPVKSVLHRHFEWDDSKAAEQYRLEQARDLIQVCVTVIESPEDPDKLVAVRMYTSLPDFRKAERGGYLRTEEVLEDAELREQAIKQAISEFQRWEEKYKNLEEFISVYDAMRAVQVKLMLRDKAPRQDSYSLHT